MGPDGVLQGTTTARAVLSSLTVVCMHGRAATYHCAEAGGDMGC